MMVTATSSPPAPSSSRRLPVEVWEQVIDAVADLSDDYKPMDREVRMVLNACRLVCRDWVPRCRLHLFDEISVNSRDTLHSLMKFLRSSPFHANRVLTLRIHASGDHPDQSWVSSIPFCLPRLPHLKLLHLDGFNFSQRHPQFYQAYSLFRTASGQTNFVLSVSHSDLITIPARIAALAIALRNPRVIVNSKETYLVQTLATVKAIRSWPQGLASHIYLETPGTLPDLLEVLPAWTFPVARWTISVQCITLQTKDELGSHWSEIQRVWEELSRIFTLSLLVNPEATHIEFREQVLGKISLTWVKDRDPVIYCVCAELECADDYSLTYLAHILPSLAMCGLSMVVFHIKKILSTSSQYWQLVDEAITQLGQGTVFAVVIMVHPNEDAPLWESFPYECVDEIYRQMLPKCAAMGLTHWCDGAWCQLHDPKRWYLQTRWTLEYLYQKLSVWTSPVKRWEITLESTLTESHGDLSRETQSVWTEISRIYALSVVARPGDAHIEFRIAELGVLTLTWIINTDPVEYIMVAMLDNADDTSLAYLSLILPNLASCGLSAIQIQVKHGWSAGQEAWHKLDATLMQPSSATVRAVGVFVHTECDAPTWETLPYECLDEFCRQMLPDCAASGILLLCEEDYSCCRLHNPQRRTRTVDASDDYDSENAEKEAEPQDEMGTQRTTRRT